MSGVLNVFKMMNGCLKTMNFSFKMMNSVLKMMNVSPFPDLATCFIGARNPSFLVNNPSSWAYFGLILFRFDPQRSHHATVSTVVRLCAHRMHNFQWETVFPAESFTFWTAHLQPVGPFCIINDEFCIINDEFCIKCDRVGGAEKVASLP